eukprot:1154449-Pelagomonas_calceolata.AAC.2
MQEFDLGLRVLQQAQALALDAMDGLSQDKHQMRLGEVMLHAIVGLTWECEPFATGMNDGIYAPHNPGHAAFPATFAGCTRNASFVLFPVLMHAVTEETISGQAAAGLSCTHCRAHTAGLSCTHCRAHTAGHTLQGSAAHTPFVATQQASGQSASLLLQFTY